MGCGASAPAAAAAPVGTGGALNQNGAAGGAAKQAAKVGGPPTSKYPRARKGSVEAELEAMDYDVTMVVDVESWLQSLQLAEYWPVFEAAGYDDLETVMDMSEADIQNDLKIEKVGHVRKLVKKVAELKASNGKRSVGNISLADVGSPKSAASPATPAIRMRKGSVEQEIEALDADGPITELTGSDNDGASPSPATTSVHPKARRTSVEEIDDAEDLDVDGAASSKAAPRARKGSVEAEIEAMDAPLGEFGGGDDNEEDPIPGASIASAPALARAGSASTANINLSDLDHIGTLGVGTFSRVKMVRIKGTSETYALKIMKKTVIEMRKQKEHVMNEKHIMQEMSGHPFLLQLKTTFKDSVYLYMLLELCQGGELFLRLLEEQTLSEEATRFYAGNIVLALEALHAKDNIYRDLKPENILLDTMGYVKIGDFGFAKKVADRTFTRCGTPEYVSPEMLGRAGHNKGTDYWSLGIFLYECLHGTTPFAAKNYLSTYKKIAAYSKHGKLKWHTELSPSVQTLIQGMLHPKPQHRLGNTTGGIDELKGHEWFRPVDWDLLLQKKLKAPFIPTIKDSTDLTYFHPEDGHHITDKEEGDEYIGDGSWFETF